MKRAFGRYVQKTSLAFAAYVYGSGDVSLEHSVWRPRVPDVSQASQAVITFMYESSGRQSCHIDERRMSQGNYVGIIRRYEVVHFDRWCCVPLAACFA